MHVQHSPLPGTGTCGMRQLAAADNKFLRVKIYIPYRTRRQTSGVVHPMNDQDLMTVLVLLVVVLVILLTPPGPGSPLPAPVPRH
jgi:hypothetical protein